ncbi:regenerating islet-derived protein 4-like [Podarcis muralis]
MDHCSAMELPNGQDVLLGSVVLPDDRAHTTRTSSPKGASGLYNIRCRRDQLHISPDLPNKESLIGHKVPMGRTTFFHLSISGFLIACSFLQGTEAISCPQDWINFQRHCYSYRQIARNWNDAEMDCQTFGQKSHLASILSKEEHKLLASAIKGAYEIKGPIWIGLFRKKEAGKNIQWRWTDSAVVSYVHWGSGQPSNSKNDKHCVEMNGADLMDWNDTQCDTENYYICKFQL